MDEDKQLENVKKRMLIPITESQIEKVKKMNECLRPEHWNKGMYDAFMMGFGLGKQEEKQGEDKEER